MRTAIESEPAAPLPDRLDRLAAHCAGAARGGVNMMIEAARKSLWPHRRPHEARRVCVYRIGNVGDIVCALPAIHSIRRAYPKAYLTLLTSPGPAAAIGAGELLGGARWLDEMLVYRSEEIADRPGRARLLRKLRERAFDIWIELPPLKTRLRTQLRNMLAARAAGAKWGGGWEVGRFNLAARAQSATFEFPNEVDRLLAVVARVGIEPGPVEFPLPIDAADRARAPRMLNAAGIASRRLAALAPGAKCEANLWPEARFAAVGRHLIARGFGVVVLGGSADRSLCVRIANEAGAVSLAGQTSLLETCAILERCEFAVCVDSGVQHLAAAVGVRCLSLSSARNFRGVWSPYGPAHTVLRKSTECDTCLLTRCPRENRCMDLIETAEVAALADRMIDARDLRSDESPAAMAACPQ